MDLVYALLVEDAGPMADRQEVRQSINDQLYRPLGDWSDPEVQEYDKDIWARKNTEAVQAMHLTGDADDPFMAPPRQDGRGVPA